MKKKRTWIIGLSLGGILLCGALAGIGLLVFGLMRGQTSPAFGQAVAVIRVEGIIQAGEPPTDFFSGNVEGAYSDVIVRQLKQAGQSPAVKAIVLRVDSPGGGVVASDDIYRQVAATDKPVVISMGTTAASGGYYISAPADEIWANRHTLTGSIGVIIQFINIEGFIEEYGIDATVIKSGANKDTGSFFRAMTPEEKEIWQTIIDESYNTFVQVIVDGRGLSEETVRKLADGRVYTGRQALELGLIDHLGTLSQAIDRAAELGGITGRPRIIDYSRSSSPFGGFRGAFHSPSPVEELQKLLRLNSGPTLMYLYTAP
ncbi:MAG: signal peptide peptidase SppA [Anaerolineae bacterium]